jgi:3-hydroxy-3-methylglutaryl CoA synthase
MKAPEKIYLDSYGSGFSHGFHTNKLNDNDIEYVRTDAFIEKSYDFIRRKICDYIVHYNYGPNNDMETMYVDSRFFDDFKNYIKE